ncbi:serine endopeptidase [Massilia sp. HP4]|uniref:serine endopeptidase n=1 Tax=Massilia sp. HP4 TaxID=2562316 RepID=UPI001E2BE108|nr:serine endopeptidase [Massilia sp. HP4]
MSKGLRLTEQWMQRALWLVALVFAAFLVGLGGLVVQNLRNVEEPLTVEQFMNPAQVGKLRAEMSAQEKRIEAARTRLEQASQKHTVAQSNTRSARSTFDDWLATRQATARPEQDPELIKRTQGLEALERAERAALAAVEGEQQTMLDATQAYERASLRWRALEEPAQHAFADEVEARELRVFLYRLALTLPLLLGAAWLFRHKRKTPDWPFAWGFILFALFTFFFELVPYLPSYGGYVRYIVGIILTIVAGRYAIAWLQGYLTRQKQAEALPDAERRQGMRYDVVQARLAKGVCRSFKLTQS